MLRLFLMLRDGDLMLCVSLPRGFEERRLLDTREPYLLAGSDSLGPGNRGQNGKNVGSHQAQKVAWDAYMPVLTSRQICGVPTTKVFVGFERTVRRLAYAKIRCALQLLSGNSAP